MTLAIGARLGPHEIVLPLGAGRLGEVYRAKDTRLEREVAVEVQRSALSAEIVFRTPRARGARPFARKVGS